MEELEEELFSYSLCLYENLIPKCRFQRAALKESEAEVGPGSETVGKTNKAAASLGMKSQKQANTRDEMNSYTQI